MIDWEYRKERAVMFAITLGVKLMVGAVMFHTWLGTLAEGEQAHAEEKADIGS